MATAPATEQRQAVQAILTTAFPAAEILPGKLHPSKAQDHMTIGVYPGSEAESQRVLDQTTVVYVQLFLPWQKKVDPEYVVDPTPLEAAAQAFREAFLAGTHPRAGTTGVWDFRLVAIDYGDDPTGQRTRFLATVQGMGLNYAETGL